MVSALAVVRLTEPQEPWVSAVRVNRYAWPVLVFISEKSRLSPEQADPEPFSFLDAPYAAAPVRIGRSAITDWEKKFPKRIWRKLCADSRIITQKISIW